MNHHELLTLIESYHAILTFLVNRGLLAARRRCCCGNQMGLWDGNSYDNYHWECPVNDCRKQRLIRAGFFFLEDSKILMSHWLYIIFLWSIDESNKKVSLLNGFLLRTVILSSQQDERNLGGWSGTAIREAWNNYYLWQVFPALQPEQSRLHACHG